MEEDIEIEMLYESNREIMMEALEETSKANNSLKKCKLNPAKDLSVEVLTSSENASCCKVNDDSKTQNNGFISDNEEYHSEDLDSAGDQVDYSVLHLISSDPNKYFLSHQSSYITQYEEDDICNETLQKSKEKALSQLIALRNMIVKRKKFLLELKCKLDQCQKEIKYKLSGAHGVLIGGEINISRESSSSKCYFRKFGMPYFSDNKGYNAPSNNDHQQKIENDELMIESIPKYNNWSKKHKDMLKAAIKDSLVAENSERLTKEITKLTNKLQKGDDNSHVGNNTVQKVTEKQNELKSLHSKTLKQFLEGENDKKEFDWMKFSLSLFDGEHSAEECRMYWKHYLNPNINKDRWSDHEDSRLKELAAQLKYQDWDTIAKQLGTNRSGYQCFVHYKSRLEGSNYSGSGKWSKYEDNKLLKVINSSKLGNFIPWAKVSSYIGNRDHNQIYNRWAKTLNPEIVKGKFSKEEDFLIVAGVEVFGATFKQLAIFLNHRTSTQLRERYERYLLPKTTKVGFWSLEEDEKLLKLIDDYGTNNWSKISKEMKTRTRTQVRQRYGFIQKMIKKNPGWNIAHATRKKKNPPRSVHNINKNIAKIKNIVYDIESVFPVSDLEKKTFLLEKLEELRCKVFSKSNSRKGHKKRVVGIDLNSDLDSSIADLFTVCSLMPSKKIANSFPNDPNSNLKKLFLLEKCFGIKLELPRIESQIEDNPRLNLPLKCWLKTVLNTDSSEISLRSLGQHSCSSSQASSRIMESTDRIDYTVPEYDNTIIMKYWWHSPAINISNLNFSEFFKRTVFDYSYGMHKDIWDSKMRRSHQVHNGYGYPVNVSLEEKLPSTHNYLFPPSESTLIGIRSAYISQGTLNQISNGMDVLNNFHLSHIKKEVIEEFEGDCNSELTTKNILNLCDKYHDILFSHFAWPHILSVNSIAKVPGYNDYCARKILKDLRGNTLSDHNTSLTSGNTFYKEKKHTNLMPNSAGLRLNRKRKLEVKDAQRKKVETELEIKKRKLNVKSSLTVERGKCRSQNKSMPTRGKRSRKKNLSNEEVPQSLALVTNTYLRKKSMRLKLRSLNNQRKTSMHGQDSVNDSDQKS